MSDIQIGVETKLSGTGMDQAEKKVRDLTGEVRKLEDASSKATAATSAGSKAHEDLGNTLGKSGDRTKNMASLTEQLNNAMRGNVSSVATAITINEQLFNTLVKGAGVLGALKVGWDVGTQIYTNIVEPLWKAADAARAAGEGMDEVVKDSALDRMRELTKIQETQLKQQKQSIDQSEKEYSHKKDLLNLQYDLTEAQINAQTPAGPQRELALAKLRQQRSGALAGLDETQLQERLGAADKNVSDAKGRLDEATGLDSARRSAAEKRLQELDFNMKVALTDDERSQYETERTRTLRRARGSGATEQIKELSSQYDAAVASRSEVETDVTRERQKLGLQQQIVSTETSGSISNIQDKIQRDKLEREQQLQRDKLEREKELLDKQMQSIRSGENPLAVSAIRERAEAQGVENYMSNNPGQRAASRSGDYARELKEAQAAEKALQNLTQTLLKKLNDVAAQLKMLDEKVANVPVQ
jgi:hypothetical protein